MAYEDFKGLLRKTASDKMLRDKAFNIAKSPKYDGYQTLLALMVHRFFEKAVILVLNLYQVKNYLKNYTNQLLKKLKNKIILIF